MLSPRRGVIVKTRIIELGFCRGRASNSWVSLSPSFSRGAYRGLSELTLSDQEAFVVISQAALNVSVWIPTGVVR